MTPQDINQAVRERYNAVGDTFFNDNLVYDAIYQAQMIMAQECFVIENIYSTTSVAGTRNYAFPTSTMTIRRVEYDGEKVIPASIDKDPKTSTTEVSGDPRLYAIWNNEIVFFPTPSATGDTILIYTYNEPQQVTSNSVLDVPSRYHPDMIDFVLSIFYAKDGNLQMSSFHRNLWESSLARIKRTRAKEKTSDELVVVADYEDRSDIFGALISG